MRLIDARRDSVVTSVGDLLALPAGAADGLIVFLLGHGFLLPRRNEPTTRVFLTEDYSQATHPATSTSGLWPISSATRCPSVT